MVQGESITAVNSFDFIHAAESAFSKKEKTEIELRSTGSCAYYGLYHRAKEVIEEKQLKALIVENASSHEYLIKTIHSIGTPNAGSVAEAMNALKKFRHICDYHLSDKVKPKHTQIKIAEARLLMERLGRL